MLVFAIIALPLAVIILRSPLGRYKEVSVAFKDSLQLAFMAPYSLALMDRLGLDRRFPRLTGRINHNIILLHGSKKGTLLCKLYFADSMSILLLVFTFGCVLAAILGDNLLLAGASIALAAAIPYVMLQELEKKNQRIKREITMELPEFLNKLILLVNAGETVQKALLRCVKQKNDEDNALYKQLRVVAAELENGYSFHQSIEEFSKRCGVQEATIFSTTLLLNYNKGGQEFVMSLREISRDLWEKRKNTTKTLGEQASSKMLFPMMFIFLVIMVIVGYPALTLM